VKKKILMMGMVLALVLTVVTPATAMAAKTPPLPVTTGEIIAITPGDVFPAGNSDRWVVKNRDIVIDFGAGDSLQGYYFLTYHTNVVVDVEDEILQAGNLQGFLRQFLGYNPDTGDPILSDKVLNVRGTISPAELMSPVGNIPIELPGGPTILISAAAYSIDIEGKWTFTSGGVGNGTFAGTIYVLICEDDGIPTLDLEGHVVAVADHDIFPVPVSTITLYD